MWWNRFSRWQLNQIHNTSSLLGWSLSFPKNLWNIFDIPKHIWFLDNLDEIKINMFTKSNLLNLIIIPHRKQKKKKNSLLSYIQKVFQCQYSYTHLSNKSTRIQRTFRLISRILPFFNMLNNTLVFNIFVNIYFLILFHVICTLLVFLSSVSLSRWPSRQKRKNPLTMNKVKDSCLTINKISLSSISLPAVVNIR